MTANKLTLRYIFRAFLCMAAFFVLPRGPMAQESGFLRIHFLHEANGKPLVLHDSIYANRAGETYSIKKLQYYLGNFRISGTVSYPEGDAYFLVRQPYMEEALALDLKLPAGTYTSVGFTLGIDSIDHCSGAQTGALDPINNMFWTWNNGYVVFKLEGNSASSPSDLGRIEHHIGGYKAGEEVAQSITLNTTEKNSIRVRKGLVTELFITVNLDKYWDGVQHISIKETPVCMTPGHLAKKIATNFPGMFKLSDIKNPK